MYGSLPSSPSLLVNPYALDFTLIDYGPIRHDIIWFFLVSLVFRHLFLTLTLMAVALNRRLLLASDMQATKLSS